MRYSEFKITESESSSRRLFSSTNAIEYTTLVIKGRWPEYEKALKDSKLDGHKKYYANLVKITPDELGVV